MRLLVDVYTNPLFQSAPLTDVRGDGADKMPCRYEAKFQSAPLTDVRGDSLSVCPSSANDVFQSAPLTDVRGDCRRFGTIRDIKGFNPLPSRM